MKFKLIKDNPLVVVFFLFLSVLFIKCLIFISFLLNNSYHIEGWKTLIMYIGVCGIISSFVFLFKWKWWMVIVSAFLDIWLIGNLIYWRSYNDLLSVYSIEAAGNMSGYWSSVFVFLEWKDAVFLLFTISLVLIIVFLPIKNRIISRKNMLFFLVCLSLSILCTFPQTKKIEKTSNMWHPLMIGYARDFWLPNTYHCTHFSPITYFFLQIRVLLSVSKEENIPKIDRYDINPFLAKMSKTIRGNEYLNLIIVLFESLETWVVNSEINNQQITPNLTNKLLSSQHCLFTDKVTDQTRNAKSMDGQFILNTGLLPISQGVTSKRYLNNYYFSIQKALQNHTKNSFLNNRGDTWNERQMALNLGYDTIFVYNDNNGYDFISCKRMTDNIPKKPHILQIVTICSHAPFEIFADSSSLITPKDMPKDMANYIKSVNYTDNALGLIFDSVNLDSTIIVVTGDHIIFHAEKRELFKKFCYKTDIDIPVEKAFVPLIIYSPEIKESVLVTDTVFQMDIYPTLLHLLHLEDYIWQGFGINLLDHDAKRKIAPDEASRLSDAIIRNDYLRTIVGL